MKRNLTRKILENHLEDGQVSPGQEIAVRIDQTLTQDATGTLVMLEFEQVGVDRVRTSLSAQYVDHNLLQEDHRNPDDHLFLRSACQKFGLHYSPPGNGVGHPVHMERFGIPGRTLLGSDSHTPAAGALGMFALGAGGVEVALAMAGEAHWIKMPAGSRVLPFRSNIPRMSQFVFEGIDPTCARRARQCRNSGSLLVAGENYGQGSSREHAALVPR